MWWQILISFFGIIFFASGIRIVRPTERGVVETLGKYSRYVRPGFNWIFPIIQHIILVDITERMEDIETQEIITKDNLNAKVDLVAYYKVRAEEESIRAKQEYKEDKERKKIKEETYFKEDNKKFDI